VLLWNFKYEELMFKDHPLCQIKLVYKIGDLQACNLKTNTSWGKDISK